MEMPLPSEGSSVDPPLAIGSALPSWQSRAVANRDPETAPLALPMSRTTQPDLGQTLDALGRGDPATDQQVMRHFISHVNAECFISLLKILDPKPDDYRARAEYKRYYAQLRETLEVPLPIPDPQPAGVAVDPLR
jgi:hypothetical protein